MERFCRDLKKKPLVLSPLFGFVEDATFALWQDINRESLVDLVLSRSNVATLEPEVRAAKVAEVLAFYDDYGRGMDGMQLPYVTHCYKAVVRAPAVDSDEPGPAGGGDGGLRRQRGHQQGGGKRPGNFHHDVGHRCSRPWRSVESTCDAGPA